MDQVPAITLSRLRAIARDAARRKVKLDPTDVLRIIEGKRA